MANMRSFFVYLISAVVVVLLASSCDDFDKWTVSPSARLRFSEDVVSFDTVISSMSSTTHTLLVFNDNGEGVRMPRVALQRGTESPFRVNVDGQYLYEGHGADFDVRSKDSIFVRIEVTVPEDDADTIIHCEDVLTFTLESGVEQSVKLVADGMNVYVMKGVTITEDTELTGDKPYLIYDSLVVAPGAKLTLHPGVCMMFHDEVSLHVHGTLDAQGTIDEPVVFRGDRMDRMFDYLPYDNTPNRWGGIHIYGDSHDNVLYQCDIHSGDYGVICDSTFLFDVQKPTVSIENSIIHNVQGYGFKATSCIANVVGTQISNTFKTSVYLLGGAYTFVHCTIAQFYPWDANRGDALYISNQIDETEEGYYPLYWAHFLNCVVTGYADDVIMGNIGENQDYMCDYLFQNCHLRTVVDSDTERFVNVVYDSKKEKPNCSDHFRLFDTKNFLYDFTPVEESGMRGIADASIAEKISPVDRMGNSRLLDGAPDAGAYEFVMPAGEEPEKTFN